MKFENIPQKIKFHSRKLLLSSLSVSKSHYMLSPFLSGIGSIFMFHRIIPKSNHERVKAVSCLEASPEYLEKLVAFLKYENRDIISLDDLIQILIEGKKPKRKFVVFTFDDGYIDNYVHAYPLLKKLKLPFTIYLTTNFPDKKAILWWYALEELVFKNSSIHFEYNNEPFHFDCQYPEQKSPTYLKIRHWIVAANSPDEQINRVRALYEATGLELYAKVNELSMTWDHVALMAQDPLVTIAAHTVTHAAMSRLSAPEVKDEMLTSKTIIEKHINKKVEHFSFPFGTEAEAGIRDFKIAKDCDFLSAVTTRNANIFPEHKDHLHCLPRILIDDDQTFDYLRLNLSGVIPYMNFGKKFVTE